MSGSHEIQKCRWLSLLFLFFRHASPKNMLKMSPDSFTISCDLQLKCKSQDKNKRPSWPSGIFKASFLSINKKLFFPCGCAAVFTFLLAFFYAERIAFQKGKVKMSQNFPQIVLLITTETRRNDTQTLLVHSGIFATDDSVLNEIERNVFQMVRERPDCWSSGCVTGYPESLFMEVEQKTLQNHGLGKRFSM